MATDTINTERWTYLGVWPGEKSTSVAVWRTEAGERVAYKNSARMRGTVGYEYAVDRHTDGSLATYPAWTGDKAHDAASLQLEAQAQADAAAEKAAEARARRSPEYKQLDDQVESFAKGLTAGARQQLIRQLSRTVWGA